MNHGLRFGNCTEVMQGRTCGIPGTRVVGGLSEAVLWHEVQHYGFQDLTLACQEARGLRLAQSTA